MHGQAAGYTVNTCAHITIQSLTCRIKQTNSKSQGRGGKKRANRRHKNPKRSNLRKEERVHAAQTTHRQTAEHTRAYYTHAHTFAVVCSRSCSSKQTTPKIKKQGKKKYTNDRKELLQSCLSTNQASKLTNNQTTQPTKIKHPSS